jgi:two-component system OmpR family sensor kinase
LLVDAAAVATEAGMAARLAHPHHRITIEVAEPLLVRADPLAISRILGNLLDNAADHSPAGAPIRLAAGRDGHEAVLTVHDQGPGVSFDARERILERYVRLDRPFPSGGGSLGLGLYIARQLAQSNGGELRAIDPLDGRGARFELRLALQPLSSP